MNFLRELNPWASLGENILPEEKKPHQRFRFSNTVEEQNFAFGNAPGNVKKMNRRNKSVRNGKNTRKLFARPTLLTPRTKASTKRNIREYESEINSQRNLNNLKKPFTRIMNMNVATHKQPWGEKWLRNKQRQPKLPISYLGYFNKLNNYTRNKYKPISNASLKKAQNWAAKIHRNEVGGV